MANLITSGPVYKETNKPNSLGEKKENNLLPTTEVFESLNKAENLTDLKNRSPRSYRNGNNNNEGQEENSNKLVSNTFENAIEGSKRTSIELTVAIASKNLIETTSSPKTTKGQSSKDPVEFLDITEPPREFYKDFIAYQLTSLKNLEDPKKFYRAIESLFYTSLCITNRHILKKLAECISGFTNKKSAKEIIDLMFENIQEYFNKNDPQCAEKFGNAFAAALMNIAEQEQKDVDENFDMTRFQERTSAEAALKRIFLKVLLSDGAAKAVYEPVLEPKFKDSFLVLLMDHILLVYEKKEFVTKDQKLDRIPRDTQEKITPEAFEKLKATASEYHAEIGTRDPDTYKKIWPKGLKTAFTGFYETLEKLAPPNDGTNDQFSTRNITITSIDEKEFSVPAWKIGSLALFGSMSIFRILFNNWREKLKENINEKYLFAESELLRDSLKKMLFDPNFYLSSLSETVSTEYTTAVSKAWQTNLLSNLDKISNQAQKKDEIELFKNIRQIIEKHQDKLPSRDFEIELSSSIRNFKFRRIANRIRELINDPSFIELIEALPLFEFSSDKKEKTNEITLLFESIMDNNTKNLSKLSNQNFAPKIKAFLDQWGEKIQFILQKNKSTNLVTTLIEFGLFKELISNMLQKAFKLPISIEKLPKMLDGFRKLPDKDLVDLFRGFANNPDFKKAFKEDIIHSLLYDTKSPLVNDFESCMFNETFLSIHFDVLLAQKKEREKDLKIAQASWNKFIPNILQLLQSQNFHEVFKKYWKDAKTEFQKYLTAIATNPYIYQKYDRFTAYVYFNKYKKLLNQTDQNLLMNKADHLLGMVYDLPTQNAAKKIRGGENYEATPVMPGDRLLVKFKKEMEIFGVEGKIKDQWGKEIYYHDALARIDASFVDFDRLGKEGESCVAASNPPEKIIKESKEYLIAEIDDLMKFLKSYAKGKTKEHIRECWHYVLRIAIDRGNEKSLKNCLSVMEEELGPLTVTDIKKHYHFIAKNKSLFSSRDIMVDYFSKKSDNGEGKKCSNLLKLITSSNSNINTEEKKESQLFDTILTPTLSILKSCMKNRPVNHMTDFLHWILDAKNQFFKDYLQLTSITQAIKLQKMLFSSISNRDVSQQVLSKLGHITAYFFTELYSDNLAMGLADSSQKNSGSYLSKQSILSKFNKIMIDMLNHKPTQELEQKDFENLSIYQQSLTPAKEMQKIVTAYHQQHPVEGIQNSIEHSFHFMLNLNMESCRVLLKSLSDSNLYEIFRKGLMDRYSAVDELLYNYNKLTLDQSLELGRKTILVAPALCYCIAALDQVKPNPKLEDVINDNSLQKTLEKAALLVRLLNDIGTTPLLKPEESLKALKISMESNPNGMDFLTRLKNTSAEHWPRIIKDITFGEFNIGLDNLREISNIHDAWQKFESNILYLSKVYQKQKAELLEEINVLNQKIGDETPGKIILNFVLFHEKLYSKSAMVREGEYASV